MVKLVMQMTFQEMAKVQNTNTKLYKNKTWQLDVKTDPNLSDPSSLFYDRLALL